MTRLLTLLLACWVAAPAVAGPLDDDRTRLMIFGPGADEAARWEAEKDRKRMGIRELAPIQAIAATEALPITGDETLRAYGDFLTEVCVGKTIPPDRVLEAIDEGVGEFLRLEYEAADTAFARAEASLPCLDGFLPDGKLSDLYFFHGLAAFYVHGPGDARSLFARSLSADPSRPWDDRFPPPPQQVFLDAGKDILHTPPRSMVVRDPGGLIQEIRVDAAEWVGFPETARDLHPGNHLVQWRTDAGGVQSLQLELVPGGQVVLLTGAGFLDAVLDGGRDQELGRVVAPAVRQVALDHGADELIIVRTGEERQVSLFDPTSGTFEPTQKERFASSFEEHRARWGPRGGLSFGIGFLSVIAPRDTWDYQYVPLCVSGEFRIVAGLYVDVAASLAVRRGETNRDSIVLLPSSRMGLKYALKLGQVRPFLGIAGQTTLYGANDVALGGGALVGLALEFPRYPALRLGLEVFAGKVRNYQLQAVAQIGVH